MLANDHRWQSEIIKLINSEAYLDAVEQLESHGVNLYVQGNQLTWETKPGIVISPDLQQALESHSKQLNIITRLTAISVNRWWETRLHQAARSGDLQEIKRLLTNGAPIDGQNKFGHSPLHLAIAHGQDEAARFLGESGADLNLGDIDGRTPLHLAAQHGHLQLAAWLISQGANVNQGDNFGLTPLYLAQATNKPEIAALLLPHGAVAIDPTLAEQDRKFLQFILKAVNSYGKELKSHTLRVAGISRWMANHFRLPIADCLEVYFGALLHDVGKLTLPDDIFEQADDELEPEHRELLATHPILGYDALGSPELNCPDSIRLIVRYHHEKWDGTGYPDELKGDDIPLGAQIVSLADFYDHLVKERSYDPALSPQEAITYLKQHASGTFFEPGLIHALEQILDELKAYLP